ncbi:MAG: glycine C-acetyltransferase, partial [Verrucomicrobiae bacterium]|nr:glycine C-acetyltransferase [Verrucomicrobiae bacterium]
MNDTFRSYLKQQIAGIRKAGTYKDERVIMSPQGSVIRVRDGQEVLNFCANNYLGLAKHPEVVEAARQAIE